MALGKGHSGLHNWLNQAETLWEEGRKERSPEDVYSRLDYQHLLTIQQPIGHSTVIYSRMGTNLACAVINPISILKVAGLNMHGFIAEWTSYYYQTKDETEAHFLCSFLNAPHVDERIKPYQTRGQWGERDISRTPFEAAPVPKFDPADDRHQKLAQISKECHQKVKKLKLEGKSIGFLRGKVRKELSNELTEIDRLVKSILA